MKLTIIFLSENTFAATLKKIFTFSLFNHCYVKLNSKIVEIDSSGNFIERREPLNYRKSSQEVFEVTLHNPLEAFSKLFEDEAAIGLQKNSATLFRDVLKKGLCNRYAKLLPSGKVSVEMLRQALQGIELASCRSVARLMSKH